MSAPAAHQIRVHPVGRHGEAGFAFWCTCGREQRGFVSSEAARAASREAHAALFEAVAR